MKNQKFIYQSVNQVAELLKNKTFTVQVGYYRKHPLNGCQLNLKFSKKKFSFSMETAPQSGVISLERYKIPRKSYLILNTQSLNNKIYVRPQAFIPMTIKVRGNTQQLRDIVGGRISEIATHSNRYYKQKHYFRLMLPAENSGNLNDFACDIFSEGKSWQRGLLKICINNNSVHFYEKKINNKYCFFVDCYNKITLNEFKKLYRSIFIALAFLTGQYFGKQGAIIGFQNIKMITPNSILYYTYGFDYTGGFPIYTTNFYPYIKPKKIKAPNGYVNFDYSAGEKLKLQYFPEDLFAKLCDFIYTNKGISRALDLYISTFNAPLELAVPTYFILLEHITFTLSGKSQRQIQILTKKHEVTALEQIQKEAIKKLSTLKKNIDTSKEDMAIVESNYSRVQTAITNINRGSNNQKLTELFDKYGYKLSKEEKDLLLQIRNKFLHGDEIVIEPDEGIGHLFHYCMRLQKLMAVLILKTIGYSGYILNNAKVYEAISKHVLKEKAFVKI